MMSYYATSLFLLKTCTLLSIVGPNACCNTPQGLLVSGLRLSTKLKAAAGGGEADEKDGVTANPDVVYAYTGSWVIQQDFGRKVRNALQGFWKNTDTPFENIELRVIQVEPERKVALFITTSDDDINVGEVHDLSFYGNTLLNVYVEDGYISIRFAPKSEREIAIRSLWHSKQAFLSFKGATGEWHAEGGEKFKSYKEYKCALGALVPAPEEVVDSFSTDGTTARAVAACAEPVTAAMGAPSAAKAKGGAAEDSSSSSSSDEEDESEEENDTVNEEEQKK